MELGFQYGDEDLEESESYKIGGSLLESIVNKYNLDENLPYNLRLIKPALSESKYKEKEGFYTYVKPPKCLKTLTRNITEYGDLILSKIPNLELEYLENMSLEEIPGAYQRIITLELAMRMAKAVGKPKSIQAIYALQQEEYQNLMFTESLTLDLEDSQDDRF